MQGIYVIHGIDPFDVRIQSEAAVVCYVRTFCGYYSELTKNEIFGNEFLAKLVFPRL